MGFATMKDDTRELYEMIYTFMTEREMSNLDTIAVLARIQAVITADMANQLAANRDPNDN